MLRPFNGKHPQLEQGAWIDETAVLIGDVQVREEASVWPASVLRGDVNRIEIGARTNIQDGTIVHVTHDGPYTPGGIPTLVGEDVTVGHRAIIHACTIGNRVLVGMGAVLMDGAVVEDDVIIGGGSLVSPGKRLLSGRLYVGSPARAVRELNAREREHLVYSARHYVQVKQQHEAGS